MTPRETPPEKTHLQLAQQAYIEWITLLDEILQNSELAFEEFTGHGLLKDMKSAGAALARAEHGIRQARMLLANAMKEGDETERP